MPRFLLVLLSLAAPVAAQPVWHLIDASPEHGYRFEDASFLTPDHGWIVNGSGETWETTDRGASWALRSTVPGYHRSTVFVSETHGWVGVLFSSTRLYETTNGGLTMTDVTSRIQPAIPVGICGLWAVSDQHIVGVGEWDGPAYLIETRDGGATWASRNMSAHAGSLIDIRYFDDQTAIAVGGTLGTQPGSRAVILMTTDGGATWSERFRSSGTGTTAEWAWKISFPSRLVGYVSVEFDGATTTGKVLKTVDGGLTWTELAVPGGDSMQGVGFLTPEIGWTSGRGTVMRTLDGGATWQPSAELDGAVNRFEFFGDSLGFAMGHRVFRFVRPTQGEAPPSPVALRLDAAPNPSPGAVTLAFATPAGAVRLDVFDTLGRRVATLLDGVTAGGPQAAVWAPGAAAPGVYVVRLSAGGHVATRSVVFAPH